MGKRKVVVDQSNEDENGHLLIIEEHKHKPKKKKKHKSLLNEDESLAEVDENKNELDGLDETDKSMTKLEKLDNLLDERISDKKKKKKRKREHKHTDECEEKDDIGRPESLVSEVSNGLSEEIEATSLSNSPRKKRKKNKKKNLDNGLDGVEKDAADTMIINDKAIEVLTESKKDKCKKKKKKQKDKVKDNDIKHTEVNNSTFDDAIISNGDIPHEEVKDLCKVEVKSPNEVERNKTKKGAKKIKKHKDKNIAQDEEVKQTTDNSETGKADGSEVKETPATGQWHTAKFENTDRQDKFLRLLGGHKKGCDNKALKSKFNLNGNIMKKSEETKSSEDNNHKKTNMAMTKIQERMYTIALESQYDKAMNLNQKRGMGLGFEKPPEEGKKFYIDVKKSKSIKFNDSD